MTLVVIGPLTRDLIIKMDEKKSKVGGASFFQAFVFEEFYPDYLCIVTGKESSLINDFPDIDKVKFIKKDNTHYFINEYPDEDNVDFRIQSTNFADIPISKGDLEDILPDDIDAFVINPLNAFDFPKETVDYLKTFDVPIYMSIQGFLRYPSEKIGDNYSIELNLTPDVKEIVRDIDGLFLDENEASILFEKDGCEDFNIKDIIVTNGSKGSRVLSNGEYKIEAVKNDCIIDATGCGDTFMAAYISKKLTTESILKSANFASKIASDKLSFFGPFKRDI